MSKNKRSKIAEFLGFGSNDDYDEEEDYFEEDDEEEQDERDSRRQRNSYEREDRVRRTRKAKVVPIQTYSNVIIFSPKKYNDVQDYVPHLIQRKHVIIKFEKKNLTLATAQRILDFMSGAAHACGAETTEIQKDVIYMFAYGQTIVEEDSTQKKKTESEGFTIGDDDD